MVGSAVTSNLYTVISKNGNYRTLEYQYSTLPSGETVPPTYVVQNIQTGEDIAFFENKSEALAYSTQVGGKSDPPNLANTKISNGTTVEINKPQVPTGSNSSNSYQKDGSSLPKTSQGVLANTMTSINNVIPAAGCPIKLPNLMEKLKTELSMMMGVESSRQSEWLTKLGEFIDPLVEEIQHAIDAVKKMMKEIQKYIDDINKTLKEVKVYIQELTQFLSFLASLPARLVNLIVTCVSQLVSGSADLLTTANAANTSASSTSTTVPTTATTGTYSNPPTANT